MAYFGLYKGGDFYRHPAATDRQYVLQSFPTQLQLLTANNGGQGKCCIFGNRDLEYANEEGRIAADYNNNLRLDLQGKAREFDVRDVVWASEL